MADDTRQQPQEDLSKEALTVDKDRKSFSGEQWKDYKQKYKSTPAANILAGGTENTAGGKLPEVSITNAFDGGLKVSDFTELPQKPCVRDSFLTGMGSGFALGGVRVILRACTWFVASACVVSGVMYPYCLYRRQAEKEGMMRAVEILNKKELEKKAREAYREKQREERRKLKEEELDQSYARLQEAKSDDGGTGRPWWKVW